MQVEEFRVINDFPNYSISNLGNVRNNKTNIILKPYIDSRKYYSVSIFDNGKKKKNIRIHRLVGNAFLDNPHNKICIDHIDNNKLNNNVNNLRWATNKENSQNTTLRNDNKSGYKGVSLCKKLNKYKAYIKHMNKILHLGYFDTKEEAALARLKKAKELYGDFMNDCENKITININAQQVIINN